jgi:hypothetical protein
MNKRYFPILTVVVSLMLVLVANGWRAAETLNESNIQISQSVEEGKVSAARITVDSSNGGPAIINMQADYPADTVLQVEASLTVKTGYYKVELLNKGKPSLVLEARDGKVVKGKGRMSATANGDVEYRVTSRNAKEAYLELLLKPVSNSAQEENKQGGGSSNATTVFMGPIKISGKASGGSISFAVSESWDTITEITVELKDLICTAKYNGQDRGVKLESWSVKQGGDEQSSKEKSAVTRISKGKFKAASPGAYELDGKFPSKKSAKGTIHLTYTYTSYYPNYESWSCDLGNWGWEAKAQ